MRLFSDKNDWLYIAKCSILNWYMHSLKMTPEIYFDLPLTFDGYFLNTFIDSVHELSFSELCFCVNHLAFLNTVEKANLIVLPCIWRFSLKCFSLICSRYVSVKIEHLNYIIVRKLILKFKKSFKLLCINYMHKIKKLMKRTSSSFSVKLLLSFQRWHSIN